MKQPTVIRQSSALQSLTANYLQTLRRLLSDQSEEGLAGLMQTMQRFAGLENNPCFNDESRRAVLAFLSQACGMAASEAIQGKDEADSDCTIDSPSPTVEEACFAEQSVPFLIKKDGVRIKEIAARRGPAVRKCRKTSLKAKIQPPKPQERYTFLCDICGSEFPTRASSETHKFQSHQSHPSY